MMVPYRAFLLALLAAPIVAQNDRMPVFPASHSCLRDANARPGRHDAQPAVA